MHLIFYSEVWLVTYWEIHTHSYQEAELPKEIKEEFCIVITEKKMRMLVIPTNYKRCFLLTWFLSLNNPAAVLIVWVFGRIQRRGNCCPNWIWLYETSTCFRMKHKNSYIYKYLYIQITLLTFCSENECMKCNKVHQLVTRYIKCNKVH